MDRPAANLLVEFVEAAALLRRDIEERQALDTYAGRMARIEQKLVALAEQIAPLDPDLAGGVRSAWQGAGQRLDLTSGGVNLADPAAATLLVAFVEKVGLLRRDMQQRKALDTYGVPVAQIEQKVSALAEHLSPDHPDLAKQIRSVWQLPARSLAFRNADHQKAMKQADAAAGDATDDGTREDDR